MTGQQLPPAGTPRAGPHGPADGPLLRPELLESAWAQPICDPTDVPAARRLDDHFLCEQSPDDMPGLSDGAAVSTSDVTIPADQSRGELLIRIYRPPSSAPVGRDAAGRATGVLLFAHGGAYCMGGLDTDHLRCLLFAQRAGVTVVSVDYALAPERPFPAGLQDCTRALEWLRRDGVGLGSTETRIGVAGVSAGGGLAAAVALWARRHHPGLLRCQMLLFPAVDHRQQTPSVRQGEGFPAWNATQNRLMWELYLNGQAPTPLASPSIATDLTGLPPALIHTASVDPLRDEGIAYASRLHEGGGEVSLRNFDGAFHVFDTAAPGTDVSRGALAEQCAFLARHLGAHRSVEHRAEHSA